GKGTSVRSDAATAGNGVRRSNARDESAEAFPSAHHFAHLTLQHLRRRELFELQITDSGVEQHSLGDESDDLAPRHRHSFGFGAQLDEIEGVVKRSLLGVDEVHRDLRLAVDLEAEAFYVLEAA